MRVRFSIAVISCLCISVSTTLAAETLTRVADVQTAVDAGLPNRDFDIRARVALSTHAADTFVAIDVTGGCRFSCNTNLFGITFQAGDLIRAHGKTIRTFENRSRAICDSIDILSHGPAPSIADISAIDIWLDKHLHRPVRIRGRVMHAFRDEIAPDWVYLILDCQNETAYAAVHTTESNVLWASTLIDAQVSIEGICDTLKYSNRRQVARLVYAVDANAIKILSPAPVDPFVAPPLSDISRRRPEEIQKLGRHGCTGKVLAAWEDSNLLVKTKDGEIIRADILQDSAPKPNDIIDIVGIPSVSGMRVSLSKSVWRQSSSTFPEGKPAIGVSLRELLTDFKGRPCINVNHYGDLILVKGLVRSLLSGESGNRLLLESHGFTVEIDAGRGNAFSPELCCGCSVSAQGIFVVETDTWKSNFLLPQIKRARIVLQGADDLRILDYPPWWTPTRLIAAIVFLSVLLLAILVWNILLRRLSERRGHELAKESLARAETDMKVFERTRLAVELHDSVAQSLTAIGMELETASRYKAGSRPELCSHLATAEKTLRSCRNDLRNCLWDLRNQALEEPDMVAAIRKTLLPHIKDVELGVRFACPREKLTDNTTHTILRIIRELVVNAISHGHASAVKIAGSIEGNDLLFSVRDNGRGFDPETAPGVLQGHFGLQGIRERLRPHKGSLRIVSAPRANTRVIVRIPIPPVKARESK